MNGVDTLGCSAGASTSLTFLPQVIKTWKERSAKDISPDDVFNCRPQRDHVGDLRNIGEQLDHYFNQCGYFSDVADDDYFKLKYK